MKTTNAQNHKLTTRPWRLAALFGVPATISLGIMVCIAARAQITPKHASVPTHQTLMSYAHSAGVSRNHDHQNVGGSPG